ncbi:hypothetical protein GW766_01470, partial [Candidatus Parcubacteria bacterium]|nr:hypothetical protein [Candidatus Parcubacteria bacterium]
TAATVATGTVVNTVIDDTDIVVFITGQFHNAGNRSQGFAHQFTASWAADTNEPVLQRGAAGSTAGAVSYAVVEFVGMNWKVQRAEHTYTQAGVTETESITAVNSLSRTFIHTQKRYNSGLAMADFGHEVWLSSIGAVSFYLPPLASVAAGHVSVVWVIENTQTSTGGMVVQRSNGNTTGGVEPLNYSVNIPTALNATNNASIFTMTTVNATTNTYPQMIAGAFIDSVSSYILWRSDTGNTLTYRTEVVQWPAADLAVRQNYYRFYVDSDTLTPSDPWPLGVSNLGENTSIGALDEPLADTDRVRIRMTAKVANATLPAGLLQLKLQYGQRDSTCSAVAVWNDVGAPGSGSIWRGYNALGVVDGTSLSGNPSTGGDLLISVANRAGRYIETAPSLANAYAVFDGEEIEYDWNIEQNAASQRTTYCFRMVKADDTPLDGYFNYPQIRTEGYTPVVTTWRWYEDEMNETPSNALAGENITPIDVLKGSAVKLRITLDEIKNLPQINARFKLQFAEQADFSDVQDVVATSSCAVDSVWCYFDGGGTDNAVISTAVLSGSGTCIAGVGTGCGTHNESAIYYNGFTHGADNNTEYEFSLTYTNVERNYGRMYYFRVYDLANNEVVSASTSNPSLQGESASLTLSISGVDADTIIAGVTMDATTTATSMNFGSLPLDTDREVAQEITVDTNAIEGYVLYSYADGQLLDTYGNDIKPVVGTNAVPLGWATACAPLAVSCAGYHTTDATLLGGSGRFAPIDSYAAISTSLDEIMYSSIATVDTAQIVYRIRVSGMQPAGDYVSTIAYIAVPVF